MVDDDIATMAWAIAARHFTRGQTDPTLMIAEGIRVERERQMSAKTVSTPVAGPAPHGA